MDKREVKRAIKKLKREGVAPERAYICVSRGDFYKVVFRGQSPTGKGSLYLGKRDSAAFVYWERLIEARDLLKAYSQVLDAIESAEVLYSQHRPAREPTSEEWYTPPEFVDMARQVMGSIDLDPASNPVAQSWIRAKNFYTKNDDGLKKSWHGKVWCNPPYGNLTQKFIRKALDSPEIDQCIFLVNRTGAAWYLDLLDCFAARCQVRKRISFIDQNGIQQSSPRYYNDFLYLGPNKCRFSEVFSSIGKVDP